MKVNFRERRNRNSFKRNLNEVKWDFTNKALVDNLRVLAFKKGGLFGIENRKE